MSIKEWCPALSERANVPNVVLCSEILFTKILFTKILFALYCIRCSMTQERRSIEEKEAAACLQPTEHKSIVQQSLIYLNIVACSLMGELEYNTKHMPTQLKYKLTLSTTY